MRFCFFFIPGEQITVYLDRVTAFLTSPNLIYKESAQRQVFFSSNSFPFRGANQALLGGNKPILRLAAILELCGTKRGELV